MKKIKKLTIALTSVVLLASSCKDDFLQEKRDLGGYNEQVFEDAGLAKAYVDYVYGLFLPGDGKAALIWDRSTDNENFTKTTDELPGETDFNKPDWPNISYERNHALKYFGARMTGSVSNNTWTRIRQINQFISEIEKHGLSKDITDPLKGQMYFWRAWQYFDLVRLYGGVPVVLTVQNPILGDNNDMAIQRSKTSECIKQICDDLDLAAQLLPGKWVSPDDWGRITSGAALALKGRVLLTWASPLFNPTDNKVRWDDAYKANLAAKTKLEENGFGLYEKGGVANGKAWGDMWFEEVGNPEAVIVYNFNTFNSDQVKRFNGWENAARPRDVGGAGSISPTKQILDAFPMKDGIDINDPASTYNLNKFYKDRDPRFYKTFAYNGSIWPYNENSNYKIWTYVWKKTASSSYNATTETRGANSSGIYLRKATNIKASNSAGDFKISGTNYMEMRFAEVILNLAESAIGSERLSEGLDFIKEIRRRAGIENNDGSYGLSAVTGNRDKLFAAVLKERQVELAYENKRFFDLRRWMLFDAGETVSRLGVQPLNGKRRTGLFISVKNSDGTDYIHNNIDPLIKPATGNVPVIERDPAVYPTGISNYEQYLDYLYDNYFKVSIKDEGLEKNNTWSFKWYPEYYYFGINKDVMDTSPYLEQTKGWNSLNGMGTFDPLL